MRTVLGILRRGLKILGWMGCGLSALLLVGTVVLWVRSLGHKERWQFYRFERRADWSAPDLAGLGILHGWSAEAIHGRLWLESCTWALQLEYKASAYFRREAISADDEKQRFDSVFHAGQPPFPAGTQRAWRMAGAGFGKWRDPIDPRIGRPRDEGLFLAVPFWMLAVLFGLWPGLVASRRVFRWRHKRLRRKRLGEGLCLHCGYDLRATPERCPECGREVVGKAD